jgi:hypothetical protein
VPKKPSVTKAFVQSSDGKQYFPLSEDTSEFVQVQFAVGRAKNGDAAPLSAYLAERGIRPAALEYLVECIIGKKRGRPRTVAVQLLINQAEMLKKFKKALRASGIRHRVHEEAMRGLESFYDSQRHSASKFGLAFGFPPVDRDKLENFMRRSKKSRAK